MKLGVSLRGVGKAFAKEVWVRVLGLLLHLWSWEVLKKIGDYCGGIIVVDEDPTFLSHP